MENDVKRFNEKKKLSDSNEEIEKQNREYIAWLNKEYEE